MSQPIRLQPLTRRRLAQLGAAGEAWLAGLPERLAELEQLWAITLCRAVPGGSNSYVARATTADGEEVVVKVVLPDVDLTVQASMLRAADGRGFVRLLAHDPQRQALLMESLGASLEQSRRPPEEQLAILADVLAPNWLSAGERRPPVGADKASRLAEMIVELWDRLDRPCSRRVRDAALDTADSLRDTPPGELVWVHGDPHPGNALAVRTPRPGAETGYVLVDAEGFPADRAYDLGVMWRDFCRHFLAAPHPRDLADRYVSILAGHTGVDADRIRRWGFLERVSSGLYVLSFGAEAVARPFLDSAELLV